jgi:RNA polymerase sigma factor (sigma-70 family)
VCNPAYLHIEYESLFVSESSPQQEYGLRHGQWTDDEIASIRVVLQKLTSIRILNSNDAEDLVQDTLLTMFTKYPERGLEKGLLIWGMGILRKKVGNYYRKTQRYASLSEQEICTGQRIQESLIATSPELKVFHEELQGIVNETLGLLPPSQRQAMELLLEGLNSREIVRQLYPERYQNVINRLYRGRQKLAKELAKYGYGPNAIAGMRRLRRCRIKK